MEILYIAFCILLAYANSIAIKEGRKIAHAANGFLHLVVATVSAIVFWIPGFIIILCNSRVAFDSALNIFREDVRLNYVSPKPASWVDRIEKSVFGLDFYTPKIIYLCISAALNIIYYVFIVK